MTYVRNEIIWRCDNCGKEGKWGDTWLNKTILHKSKASGGSWDEDVVVCSAECAKLFDDTRRRIKAIPLKFRFKTRTTP